jgi:hypothetical protein
MSNANELAGYYSDYNDELVDNDLILNKNVFSVKSIEKNIDNLTLWVILTTQILTPEFCLHYLYLLNNNKYVKDDRDQEIFIDDILKYQPHITKENFELIIKKYHLKCSLD